MIGLFAGEAGNLSQNQFIRPFGSNVPPCGATSHAASICGGGKSRQGQCVFYLLPKRYKEIAPIKSGHQEECRRRACVSPSVI